jgi:hypothetical protein
MPYAGSSESLDRAAIGEGEKEIGRKSLYGWLLFFYSFLMLDVESLGMPGKGVQPSDYLHHGKLQCDLAIALWC